MFNLEYQLGKWRAEMAATGLASEILDELEVHLRDDVEQQVRGGTEPAKAFAAALGRIGSPRELRDEFAVSRPRLTTALRRHRWKAWLSAAICLLVGAILTLLRPASYVSQATFVVQHAVPPPVAVTPDTPEMRRVAYLERADQMLGDVELLRSFDMAKKVALAIGPDVVLRQARGGEDANAAAALLQRGFYAGASPQGGVVRLSLRHPDSEVVQPALQEWIRLYAEIRQSIAIRGAKDAGAVTIVTQQAPSNPRSDFALGQRVSELALLALAGFLVGVVWMLIAGAIDVYFGSLAHVARRHKWKFVLCAGGALAAATTIYALRPVVYQSETKLFVRQVLAPEAGIAEGGLATRRVPSADSAAIMDREVDRLTSAELLRRAAIRVGSEKILSKVGGGQDPDRAVAEIRRGLTVVIVPNSSVIRLLFQHPDASIVRPVLNEIADQYVQLHSAAIRPEVYTANDIRKITSVSMIQKPPPAFIDRASALRVFIQVVLAGIVAGLAWMAVAGLMDRRAKLAE